MTKPSGIVKARQEKIKKEIIEQLKKLPIVQIACERIGVGRASFYRYRTEDENFRKAIDGAIAEGETMITDMSESQLISLIRDKNFPAIQLWLRHHHPKYANKIEIDAKLKTAPEELTPEQKEAVRRALKLAALTDEDKLELKINKGDK